MFFQLEYVCFILAFNCLITWFFNFFIRVEIWIVFVINKCYIFLNLLELLSSFSFFFFYFSSCSPHFFFSSHSHSFLNFSSCFFSSSSSRACSTILFCSSASLSLASLSSSSFCFYFCNSHSMFSLLSLLAVIHSPICSADFVYGLE